MGKYFDLHVVPLVEDLQSCVQLAEVLHLAGYATIGLTVPTGLRRERTEAIRDIFAKNRVDTILRVDLAPTSRSELLRSLRRFRNLYDLLAVKCLNQRVSTVACRDRRVDLVFFDPTNNASRFNHSFARLLRGSLELNLVSDIIALHRTSGISQLWKTIAIAREHRVKILLSSGARKAKLIRSPLQMSALGTALGLGQDESIKGVTSSPASVVSTTLMRRDADYVEEGVNVVSGLKR